MQIGKNLADCLMMLNMCNDHFFQNFLNEGKVRNWAIVLNDSCVKSMYYERQSVTELLIG